MKVIAENERNRFCRHYISPYILGAERCVRGRIKNPPLPHHNPISQLITWYIVDDDVTVYSHSCSFLHRFLFGINSFMRFIRFPLSLFHTHLKLYLMISSCVSVYMTFIYSKYIVGSKMRHMCWYFCVFLEFHARMVAGR